MNDNLLSTLVQQLNAKSGPQLSRRYGTITGVSGNRVTVSLQSGGGTITVPKMGSYNAKVGDTAVIDTVGSDPMAIGSTNTEVPQSVHVTSATIANLFMGSFSTSTYSGKSASFGLSYPASYVVVTPRYNFNACNVSVSGTSVAIDCYNGSSGLATGTGVGGYYCAWGGDAKTFLTNVTLS